MSNTVTFRTLATRYADAQNTADRAAVRLTEHAEWAGYVARVVKGNRADLAREILGVTHDEQKSNKVTHRRVETLATLLGRHASAGNTPEAGVVRVSLSGEGGGSSVVPADHELHAAIVAFLAGKSDA